MTNKYTLVSVVAAVPEHATDYVVLAPQHYTISESKVSLLVLSGVTGPSGATGSSGVTGPAGIDGTSNSSVTWSTLDTGFGVALFGANCPAGILTSPVGWIKATLSDGTVCYVPAWK